jgi:hypothetical protein
MRMRFDCGFSSLRDARVHQRGYRRRRDIESRVARVQAGSGSEPIVRDEEQGMTVAKVLRHLLVLLGSRNRAAPAQLFLHHVVVFELGLRPMPRGLV